MNETSSRPNHEISPTFLENAQKSRTLGGYKIKRIGKTHSNLDLFEDNLGETFLRNSYLPTQSMAAWEFLYKHAHEILNAQTSRTIFGSWGVAQVAPILNRGEKTRTYYSQDSASAYGEIVGYNTLELLNLWNLTDIANKYFNPKNVDLRCVKLSLISYNLTKDLIEQFPNLDESGKLTTLIESYRHEKLSSKLIAIGHRIAIFLRTKIYELEETDSKQMPNREAMLFLLHLYQAITQDSIIKWLGINHGHFHLYNVVSMITQDNKASSPLETRIIDFDIARLDPKSLSNNEELYKHVDTKKIKEKINDEQININLRLQFIAYLPPKAWDEKTFDLIGRNFANDIAKKILQLVSLKVIKEIIEQKAFDRFLNFIYEYEKNNNKTDQSEDFELTAQILKESVNKTTDLKFKVFYLYLESSFANINLEALSDEQKIILLVAISSKSDEGIANLASFKNEFEYAFLLIEQQGMTSHQAEKMILKILSESYQLKRSIANILSSKDLQLAELAEKIFIFIFMKKRDHKATSIQESFLRVDNLQKIKQLLEQLNFRNMSTEVAHTVYTNISQTISEMYPYRNNPILKFTLLNHLNVVIQKARRTSFLISYTIRNLFSSFSDNRSRVN